MIDKAYSNAGIPSQPSNSRGATRVVIGTTQSGIGVVSYPSYLEFVSRAYSTGPSYISGQLDGGYIGDEGTQLYLETLSDFARYSSIFCMPLSIDILRTSIAHLQIGLSNGMVNIDSRPHSEAIGLPESSWYDLSLSHMLHLRPSVILDNYRAILEIHPEWIYSHIAIFGYAENANLGPGSEVTPPIAMFSQSWR